ncbi:hypothetical protein ACHAPT_006259 [Fusarium lateritium]
MTLYSNDDDEQPSSSQPEEEIQDPSFAFSSSHSTNVYIQSESSITVDVPQSDPFGSDTSSASDTDTDTDYDSDDFDDQISVDNQLWDQPYYSEYDEDLNVLHGAQVVNFTSVHYQVDLEVFLAEDENEAEELPEMQMSVDRESFEYWCRSEDAVDVELDGARLRCTGELFDPGEVADWSSDEGEGEEEDEDMDILVYE